MVSVCQYSRDTPRITSGADEATDKVRGNAITWNGTSLSAPANIDANGHLVAVSCPSASFCMAVGGADDWLVWNGTSWSTPHPIRTIRPSPEPAFINWVSCPTASFCVAVLSDGEALVWNGTSWSAPQSINPNLANARGPAAQTSVGEPRPRNEIGVVPHGEFLRGGRL